MIKLNDSERMRIPKMNVALVLLLTLASCCESYQYNVLVENNTSATINVEVFLSVEEWKIHESDLEVAAGTSLVVAQTPNLRAENGFKGRVEDCSNFYGAIRASSSGLVSAKDLCHESVEFVISDIEQREFVVKFESEDL
jgi:hypothetical protein